MTDTSKEKDNSIPFFPDHVRTEAWVVVGILVLAFVIGAIAITRPIGLEPPADPMDTPAHVKPEWYFLFLYELLKYVPKTVGVLIPILGVIVLALWPLLDKRDDSRNARSRRIIATIIAMTVIVILTVMGLS